MSEFEGGEKELFSFREEIKKIQARDKTLFALKDVNSLDENARQMWEDFSQIFEYASPESLSEACDELADAMKSSEKANQDITEFYSWMISKLSVLKSSADTRTLGNITEEEFINDISDVKKSITG